MVSITAPAGKPTFLVSSNRAKSCTNTARGHAICKSKTLGRRTPLRNFGSECNTSPTSNPLWSTMLSRADSHQCCRAANELDYFSLSKRAIYECCEERACGWRGHRWSRLKPRLSPSCVLEASCSEGECTKYQVFSGTTALHAAVLYGKLDVLRLLLRWGGDLNVVDSIGSTPLNSLCEQARPDATGVATLLEAGADPRLADDVHGRLALHNAAAQGHVEQFDMLLLKTPSMLNMPSSEGHTPLFLAAMNGMETMVLHLLRLGAKQPVELDKKKNTCPFRVAMVSDHDEVLRTLLDHGMDAVGSKDTIAASMGYTVCCGRAANLYAMLAPFDGDDDDRQHLARLSPGGGSTLLHRAVSHGRRATTSILLAAGADETTHDKDGRCASEVIGDSEDDVDAATEAALRRMLERAPAFRAAAWRWRASMGSSAGGAGTTVVVVAPEERQAGLLSVRIFRARRKKKVFVRLVNMLAK